VALVKNVALFWNSKHPGAIPKWKGGVPDH
jgi:hypothetical protein